MSDNVENPEYRQEIDLDPILAELLKELPENSAIYRLVAQLANAVEENDRELRRYLEHGMRRMASNEHTAVGSTAYTTFTWTRLADLVLGQGPSVRFHKMQRRSKLLVSVHGHFDWQEEDQPEE